MSQAGKLRDGSIASDIEYLQGDAGLPAGPNALFIVDILGGIGIATVSDPVTNSITINTTGVVNPWTREVGAAVAMVVDHGYINTNAGATTFTLPAVAEVGDLIEICGEGAGGWIIAQNALQSIRFGNLVSTVGIGGSLASTNQWDTVKLVCRVANTDFSVLSNVGVLNVI